MTFLALLGRMLLTSYAGSRLHFPLSVPWDGPIKMEIKAP